MGPFWLEPSSGLQTADFLLHPHMMERGGEQASSLGPSYEGANPINECSTLVI